MTIIVVVRATGPPSPSCGTHGSPCCPSSSLTSLVGMVLNRHRNPRSTTVSGMCGQVSLSGIMIRATSLSSAPLIAWSFRKMFYERREDILAKIASRLSIIDLGYQINGKSSPCRIWQGPTSGNGRGGGYARMCLNNTTVAVHIVVFTHYFGYIPPKKQIDHLCNNRLCCNPDHLEMVTHKTNQKRRAAR